jgi:uroporphyrinogen decarboxylase
MTAAQETLSRRERVLRSIEHRPVDRTPIDLGIHHSTGISGFAYQNLREYLGLPKKKIEIVNSSSFLARVDQDVLERFHCDCMVFHPGYPQTQTWRPREHYEFEISAQINAERNEKGDWTFSNAEGMRMVSPAGGFFFDGQRFDAWPAATHNFNAEVAKHAERVYKETDYFSLYIDGLRPYFSGDADYLVTLLEDPDEITRRCEREYHDNVKAFSDIVAKCGHYLQGISISSDLGMQAAPFVNPELYAELIAPWIKQTIAFIKNNSDYKVFFHSCGAMEPFIPILIDCGVDILNPVQVSCKNMEPTALKKNYGDKICFWGGGCNTHGVFGKGTPAEVADNVRYLMSVLAPHSGFVFNQVHNVMGNVKPENIVAMLDTAYEESFKYGELK